MLKLNNSRLGTAGACKCGTASPCSGTSNICKSDFFTNNNISGTGGICKCGNSAICSGLSDTCKEWG